LFLIFVSHQLQHIRLKLITEKIAHWDKTIERNNTLGRVSQCVFVVKHNRLINEKYIFLEIPLISL